MKKPSNKENIIIELSGYRYCEFCGEIKELTSFKKIKSGNKGRTRKCKTCSNIRAKELNNLRKVKATDFQLNNIYRVCGCCKKRKLLKDFYQSLISKYGRGNVCKDCKKEQAKTYSLNNPGKIKEYNKKKYRKNKDIKRQIDKEYYIENKDKIKSRIKEYRSNPETKEKRNKREKIRREEDLNYKINCNLRGRLRHIVRNRNTVIQGTTEELLGCAIDFFIQYIENLFKENMSWHNYGLYGWHLDHIIPLSSFDLTNIEEQKIAFHYTNIQPLWAKDNLRKGSKINGV